MSLKCHTLVAVRLLLYGLAINTATANRENMPRRASLKVIERKIRELQQKAEQIKKQKTNPALRKIVQLVRKHGISIGDLSRAVNGRGGRRVRPSALRGKKVKPMFRNPKTGETWTGRGRPARWIAAAEKAGHKRTEFLIKKS
jgi:DNA-binding protein H-NS